jgi:hypothetical protein
LTLVLAGIADGTVCTNGEAYNGTYILPWYSGCSWKLELSPPICPTSSLDTAAIWVTVFKLLGGNYFIRADIRIYDASANYNSQYNFILDSGQDATKWDCKNLADVEIPYDSETVNLDWIDCTAATSTVTSGT